MTEAHLTLRRDVRPDGTELIWQDATLPPVPRCMTERFMHWAATTPDAVWMSERGADREWQPVTYAQGAALIRGIASALLAQGLSVERPLLILSGNSVAHALMALAAQHVGIPSAALSPAYALTGDDRGKLMSVRDQLTPGMIFVDAPAAFLPAINAVFGPDVPVACVAGNVPGRPCFLFADMANTPPSAAMEAAHAAVGPDTVAKFLFTSGTTGKPKAVIQTQGMLCSNQVMIRCSYAFLQDGPPVLVDWAPWNHTASGNKVFNMAIFNGGSYFIDDGRPTPDGIGRTLRTLREVAPTWYFNVPLGFQFLLDAMEQDESLTARFFSRLKMVMYAGAGMSQPVWDRLTRLAERMVPGGVPIVSGLGSTETGPFALYYTDKKSAPGNIGVPAVGVVLKLVPTEGKLEARLKSPSITPGYWRDAKLTAEAFDDEGFYCLGDALRYASPGDPSGGFMFDGRLAENFKLASGTWVAVGALRARLVDALQGMAADAVIAGDGRDDLRALLVPNWTVLRQLAGQEDLPHADLIRHPQVRAALSERLTANAATATGSAARVVAALLMADPLRFDLGEVTDKGSVNQRAVLRERAGLVATLYDGSADVVRVQKRG